MKFSIITPVYNGERYIRETIESVFSQNGNFEIEYIIVDGGSSDKTIEIIKEYEEKLKNNNFPLKCRSFDLKWMSKKDSGMYDAINKGFKMATGDIFAWINHDDKYKLGVFEIISKTFQKFPKISWLKGTTSYINSSGKLTSSGLCMVYNQNWLSMGVYGRNAYFVYQDSVFWKRELWNKIGEIPTEYRFAGDYWLWINFAKYEKLWTLKTDTSFFRKRDKQLSSDMKKYREEQMKISLEKGLLNLKIKIYFWIKSKLKKRWQNKIMILLYKLIFWNINRDYVDLNSTNTPIMKKINFYIC
ncbi:MAG: family 2 glycosyl transferase [Parcubacteria group bacterium Athens0714_16]|nr:MAG: family 2 glycosyl transferase [Parcubacteria group bacterium Athens0714_16]